jgi:hypothetical protein
VQQQEQQPEQQQQEQQQSLLNPNTTSRMLPGYRRFKVGPVPITTAVKSPAAARQIACQKCLILISYAGSFCSCVQPGCVALGQHCCVPFALNSGSICVNA